MDPRLQTGLPHADNLWHFDVVKPEFSKEADPVHYVYILRSQTRPDCYYVGLTSDLKSRIQAHNSGASRHTAKIRPWTLKTYVAFNSRSKAFRFERYLKSGSGREFAKRHF